MHTHDFVYDGRHFNHSHNKLVFSFNMTHVLCLNKYMHAPNIIS